MTGDEMAKPVASARWQAVSRALADGTAQWHMASRTSAQEADWLRAGGLPHELPCVKENACRLVLHSPGPCGGVFVKVSFHRGWHRVLQRVRRCNAEIEFAAIGTLAEADVAVVEPVAWCRGAGFDLLVTRAVEDSSDLADLVGPNTDPALVAEACRFADRLLAAGVRHPSLDDRNILARRTGTGWALCLVGMTGVEIPHRPPRRADALGLLGWLMPLLERVEDRQGHLELATASWSDLQCDWRDVERRQVTGLHRAWRKKRRLFVRQSSMCLITHDAAGICVRRANVRLEAIVKAIRATGGSPEPEQLKRDGKRTLWRVPTDEGTVIVKKYTRGARRLIAGGAALSWLASARLQHLHVPAIRCLGHLATADRDAYLVMEDAGKHNVRSFIAAHPGEPDTVRAILAAAARYIALLHRRGVWHRDLKASNLVVSDAADSVELCDLDDACFSFPVSARAVRRSLGHFLTTLPATVPPQARLRFLVVYGQAAGLLAKHVRQIHHDLLAGYGSDIHGGQP